MDVSGASAIEADGKLRTAIARSSVDAVIAVGGDGLMNLAASTVVDTGIPLAVIPAGTGDDIARGLGISRRTHQDIATLVAALAHVKIPTGPWTWSKCGRGSTVTAPLARPTAISYRFSPPV